MKRLLAFFLTMMILFGIMTSVEAVDEDALFVVIKTPCQEISSSYHARFVDTKQPIPLSRNHDGYVYATVPAKDANREIEVFLPEGNTVRDILRSAALVDMVNLGVIKGDADGYARPYGKVTRAEAVAMVMRFIGLHGDTEYELPFVDVNHDDWFYGVVAEAYKAGIIAGESENVFNPHRNITLEEATVIVARAIKYANLPWDRSAGIPNISDANEISEWATEAYNILGEHSVTVEVGYGTSKQKLLCPQREAERQDFARMLYKVYLFYQVYPDSITAEFGLDAAMPSIDGSTSTYVLTESLYDMLFYRGNVHPQKPISHSKSHESYERLIDGEVDMLFAATLPTSDLLEYAKEKGVELEYIPIAHDAMVFFTNKENPATGITREQIGEIYINNGYKNWSEIGGEDAEIYPYCRNHDSGSHAYMEQYFLEDKDIHPDVRMQTSMSMSNILSEVEYSASEEPLGYGLGYSVYYYFNDATRFERRNLKLLAIDGVYPTNETIADGSYPLSGDVYIVIRKDTPKDSPARKVVSFVLSEAGQNFIDHAGYIAVGGN